MSAISRPPGNQWKTFAVRMKQGSRAEHVHSVRVSRCTLRKRDLCVGRVVDHLITGGPSPPLPSHHREGNGGAVIFHVWARKTKVIHSLFPMQDDRCETMPKASTGDITPRKDGERGKLSDSQCAACSAICSCNCQLLHRPFHKACGKVTILCQSSLVGVSQDYI